MSYTRKLIEALQSLGTGWDHRGRKGSFQAATFTDIKGRHFGLWHSEILVGAVARWPLESEVGQVAQAMDCSTYALAGLTKLIAGARSALQYIVDSVPVDHGQWQVGEAWGGLEEGLTAVTGREAGVSAASVTEHENRWGSIAGPFKASSPSELVVLRSRLSIEREAASKDTVTGEVRAKHIVKIKAAISDSQAEICAKFPGTLQFGHPDFDCAQVEAHWKTRPKAIEVTEFISNGSQASGSADEFRPLLVNGRLRDSETETLPVAIFSNLEQAQKAALKIPNRTPGCILAFFPHEV